MKRTLLLIAMAGMVFAACEKENETNKLDSDALVYLNGVENPKFKSTTTQYSLYEILRADYVLLVNSVGGRGFSDNQRDTVNNRLLMWATDILPMDGTLSLGFIGATNTHIMIPNGIPDPSQQLGTKWDTVGYIPNSVLASARTQIEALYAQERYDEIYELFHTAFTFYTCTGQEYKDIVANGGN